jgi:hypothetical protein
MKSTKVFNNISDKLKASIPKLKPGEVVTFKMLNGVPNPDPDPLEKEKNPVLFGKLQVNTNARIYDQHIKDASGKEVGGYVDIGCVDRWDGEMPERFRLFVPGMGNYSRFQGKFSLVGGKASDEELYEFLWLTPERKGSPCADSGIEPILEIVDLKADVKSSVGKYDTLRKAIAYSDLLINDLPKARSIMASLNQPSYQDPEVLMASIMDLARNKPEDFIKTFDAEETPTIGVIKDAVDAGVISHDIASGAVTMGGVKLMDLKIERGEDFPRQMAIWIKTATNGNDVLNNIKSRLKKEPVK